MGTIADVMAAMIGQNVFMLHVSDAIEATNGLQAGPAAYPVAEGFVFAGCDPLALDVLGARYLFSNTPMAEAVKIKEEQNLKSDFLQKVPLPCLERENIITKQGYDSPLWRYSAIQYYQERGIGNPDYFVTGKDIREGGDLASLAGHLGQVQDGVFKEHKTESFYSAVAKPLWDLQATSLAYLEANDQLEGTSRVMEIMEALDENKDGVIDYHEFGKFSGNDWTSQLIRLMAVDSEPAVALKCRSLSMTEGIRRIKPEWNAQSDQPASIWQINGAITAALNMSKVPADMPDPFYPGVTWGNGNWPSLRLVEKALIGRSIFGPEFPERVHWMSPYGFAFCYADIKWGGGKFTGGTIPLMTDPTNFVEMYHQSVDEGEDLLPFTFYVPEGYGKRVEKTIPNVEETRDPELIFTTSFDNGSENWRELTAADFPD